MKGILLAGGIGTRLYPITRVASKQLQTVYDKPMVYYPLTTLIENEVRDICLISTPQDLPRFKTLFDDGSQWGINLTYREQEKPAGIAQAFLIAEDFIQQSNVALILGDNMFSGKEQLRRAFSYFKEGTGAVILGFEVNNPSRYGVVEFDNEGKAISLEEKPAVPKSKYAVPGLYLYDSSVVEIARNLTPSNRGELEITDVNKTFLHQGRLRVCKLEQGFAWMDAGTVASLHESADYVRVIEHLQGVKIGCPEEAALRVGFLSLEKFNSLVDAMPDCEYRNYLAKISRSERGSS